MLTGRQTLASIEQTIAQLHGEETRIDTALRSATAEAERLREERAHALKELARIKLGEMAAGRLVEDLDAAERRALEILEDHRHRLTATTERRTAALAEVQTAERLRDEAAQAVETALAEVEALRVEAEARVQAMPEWQQAKARCEAADKVAGEAERKSAQSQAELGAKKRPYDDDPLFIYLWTRNYGTARYSAGNIVRLIDGIVADFVGFAGARANYAMLIEIPTRLAEHAKAQRAKADAERSALAAIERREMIAAGIEAKEKALTAARHKLAAADATLEVKRGQLMQIEEVRNALMAAGSTPGYEEALQTIVAGDAQDDLRTLFREARRTTTQADEEIVRRIDLIDQRLEAVGKEIGRLRVSARDVAGRINEVERTRDRFRQAGYDHPNATFGNDVQIGRVLAQILEGVVRSGILWDILREGFRTRPPRGRPDFGSPNFLFPFPMPGGGDRGPAGGDWRDPGARGGWFPDRGGSRGRDDDFTTGGSF